MSQEKNDVQSVYEEVGRFEKTMEEVYFLKRVAKDLKSYRRMIRLRKYD